MLLFFSARTCRWCLVWFQPRHIKHFNKTYQASDEGTSLTRVHVSPTHGVKHMLPAVFMVQQVLKSSDQQHGSVWPSAGGLHSYRLIGWSDVCVKSTWTGGFYKAFRVWCCGTTLCQTLEQKSSSDLHSFKHLFMWVYSCFEWYFIQQPVFVGLNL